MKRFWLTTLGLLLAVYFIVLRPSFNMALTGDDYLGLWRYNFYTRGYGGETMSNIKFFFTDYGPQDVMTAIIHNYWGFNHRVYYTFAFVFRLMASLSFLWPVYKLTKNRWAAVGAAAFFSITTTGLETTDWSFNMPSYLAIALMNTLLGLFFVSREKNTIWVWLSLSVLFVLTIVSQPIRMIFLPLLLISLELYWLITNIKSKKIWLSVLRIGLYILLTFCVLKYTNIGGAVSARGTKALVQNYGAVLKYIKGPDYRIFLSPIKQVGMILIPNEFMYQRLEVWGLSRTFKRVVIPTYFTFVLGLLIFKIRKLQLVLSVIAGLTWTGFIWKSFMNLSDNPLQPFELFTYLVGGYFLIAAFLIWRRLKDEKNLQLGLVLSVSVIFFGFILFWMRNPGFMYEIIGRYLIVSGAGLAWFTAIMLSKKKYVAVLLFALLFSLHARSSYTYLSHLSDVRGIELTDKLRGSVKRATNFGNTTVPLVFYFEGDNPEILHHAFIFGFPVISSFQFGNYGSWYNIAATNNWKEVESAYLTGDSLKRFMPGPYFPAKLEDIYAYKLQNRELIDVTEEKRALLLGLEKTVGDR